jgi:hypothetical protein
MLRNFNLPEPPEELIQYLKDNPPPRLKYRQRAVLVKYPGNTWHLVCCVVQALSRDRGYPDPVSSRSYESAILFEEWWDSEVCQQFILDLQSGTIRFGDVTLNRAMSANWHAEFHPSINHIMREAGLIVKTRFEEKQIDLSTDLLVRKGLPFYGNVEEAARDWLPFEKYHGQSDGRNQDILFLLPEFRAHITGSSWSNGVLEIDVDGSDARANRPLFVKGSYHVGNRSGHFESPVVKQKTTVNMESNAERFQYVLTDADDRVFDFRDTLTERRYLTSTTSLSGSADEDRESEDYEVSILDEIPAADRFVRLDHNSKHYRDALKDLEQLVCAIEAANNYEDTEDKEQRLAELSAGRRLLAAVRIRARLVWRVLAVPIVWIIEKFAEGFIGEVGKTALQSLRALLHV